MDTVITANPRSLN